MPEYVDKYLLIRNIHDDQNNTDPVEIIKFMRVADVVPRAEYDELLLQYNNLKKHQPGFCAGCAIEENDCIVDKNAHLETENKKVKAENKELKKQLRVAINDIVHDCPTCKMESTCPNRDQYLNPDRCKCNSWEWHGAKPAEQENK